MTARLTAAAAALACVFVLGASDAGAAEEAPIKEVLAARVGGEVDPATKGSVCTEVSKCHEAVPSAAPGGFFFPEGVAVETDASSPHYGHVYVGDRGNDRLQEFTAAGVFVAMYGREVNATKTHEFNEPGNPHGISAAEENICTESEITSAGVKCQAGREGTQPAEFETIHSLSFDPVSGDLYVQERARVQKLTSEGQFIWAAGKEVNETKAAAVKAKGGTPSPAEQEEENLCTEEEIETHGVSCGGGSARSIGSAEPDSFNFNVEQGFQDLVAVGGPEDLLYVADTGRVLQIQANGRQKREIGTSGPIGGVAVDGSGDVYAVAEAGNGSICEFGPAGEPLRCFTIAPRQAGSALEIGGIAIDPRGQLALTERESGHGNEFFGTLYEPATTSPITGFTVSPTALVDALSFSAANELFAVETSHHEALFYTPKPVAELRSKSGSAASCSEGEAGGESDVAFNCQLSGEIDPWGVRETNVWFEWGGSTLLTERTPEQTVPVTGSEGEKEATTQVSATLSHVRPNETVYYRLGAHDHWVKGSEQLASPPPLAQVSTPNVVPREIGTPSSSFVSNSTAVLFATLNPENSSTSYRFQYVARAEQDSDQSCREFEASCPGLAQSPVSTSSAYGKIGASAQVAGLQAGTEYSFRLFAVNALGPAVGEGGQPIAVGAFTTSAVVLPQATTGGTTGVGSTVATITGTVDPGSTSATYAFELGIEKGTAAQYGVVFSAPVAAGSGPVTESLSLAGLQPGTAYTYRIVAKSGFGETVGSSVTFVTQGLPESLESPASLGLLPVPTIHFPAPEKKKKAKPLTAAEKLAKALKACTKKPKSRRAACRRAAHKKYPARRKTVSKKSGRGHSSESGR